MFQTSRNPGALDSGIPRSENTEWVSRPLRPDAYLEWNIVPWRDKSLLNPWITPTLERRRESGGQARRGGGERGVQRNVE